MELSDESSDRSGGAGGSDRGEAAVALRGATAAPPPAAAPPPGRWAVRRAQPGVGRHGGRAGGAGRPPHDGRPPAPATGTQPRDGGRDEREARGTTAGTEVPPPARAAHPDEVTGKELDRSVHQQLRTLSKENAEGVAQHLVMVAATLEADDLEAALAHAETAVRRAGRVPAAREALGMVAYRMGDFARPSPSSARCAASAAPRTSSRSWSTASVAWDGTAGPSTWPPPPRRPP